MKKQFVSFAAATALAALCGSAFAVTSQIGDEDGFGLGIANGQGFSYASIGAGDGDGTDVWQYGDQSYVFNYSLPSAPVSASLEVFTGGQGLDGLTSVFINGSLVGTLTDGDNVGPSYNYAWKDTFDVTSFVAQLTGNDTLTFQPFTGGGDGWVLDYAKLTVSAVPEPSTYALLLLGLVGVAAFARRRKA